MCLLVLLEIIYNAAQNKQHVYKNYSRQIVPRLRVEAYSHEGKQTVVSVFCPVNADCMFISVKSTTVCAFSTFSFYKPEADRNRF